MQRYYSHVMEMQTFWLQSWTILATMREQSSHPHRVKIKFQRYFSRSNFILHLLRVSMLNGSSRSLLQRTRFWRKFRASVGFRFSLVLRLRLNCFAAKKKKRKNDLQGGQAAFGIAVPRWFIFLVKDWKFCGLFGFLSFHQRKGARWVMSSVFLSPVPTA